jgi:membrane protein YdbS with pleckstrin-like domain
VATDPEPALTEPAEAWLRPSPRLGTMRRVEILAASVASALAVLAATGLEALAGAQMNVAPVALLLAGIVLAGFLGDRFAQRRVRAWAYCEREDDLLVRRGVMISRLSVIPYGRMQFIDVVAGPIERAFGLATVRMHTAAASSDARIPGLPQEEAARLRDHLARLGEAKAAGL